MPATVSTNHRVVHESQFNAASSEKAEIKIAYIGGGSRQWAPVLMGDLALSTHLEGELCLYDIDHVAAQRNAERGNRLFDHPDAATRFVVRQEDALAAALAGADFVVISIEPGPTALRYADLEIPAKYGILQTVGDTTGPGGILRGLRSVPIFTEFAAEIMTHCPDAWVINYTNPMSLCTAALFAAAPEIKAIGCCHEVFGTQKMLSSLAAKWYGVTAPQRNEIDLAIAGVNHFTFATSARWQGHDLLGRLREKIAAPDFFASRADEARRAVAKEEWYASSSLVACDFLQRFGVLGAAGDRHLVEFVPWYLQNEEELHRWGVVVTPYSWRLKRSTTPVDYHKVPRLTPSDEEGVQQIEALLGLRALTTNVNLPNRGQMDFAADGAVVETYAQFSRNSVVPVVAPALPAGARSLVERALQEQTMTLEAALTKDNDLAFQALLTHPLMHLPTDKAAQMFQEMLEAGATACP